MAEGKTSFVFYASYIGIFEALPDDLAGQLIKHVLKFVNDENPQTDNFMINALFAPIKTNLEADLEKWKLMKVQRSEAGKNSAKARKEGKNKALELEQIQLKNNQSLKGVSEKQQALTGVDFRATENEQDLTNSTVNVNVNVSTNVDDKKGDVFVADDDCFNVVSTGKYQQIKNKVNGSYFETQEYRDEVEKNIALLLSYNQWKSQIAKSLECESIEEVDAWLERYKSRIFEVSKMDVSLNELKSHFVNWVRKVKPKGVVVLKKTMTAEEKREARSKRFMTN